MKHSLQLRLSQHLTLTPQLQQSIRLLQLSTQELDQELERYLRENPLLERDDGARESLPRDDAGDIPNEAPTTASSTEMESSAESAPQDTEIIGDLSYSSSREDSEDGEYQQVAEDAPTLREHLLGQLSLLNLPTRDRCLVELLIDSLNEEGYLTQELDDVLAMLPPELNLERDELNIALMHLQHLEPAGVGARNLGECLLLQLKVFPDCTPYLAEAKEIVSLHIDALAARDFVRLKKALHCDDTSLRAAQKLIVNLNPKPGSGYAADEARYIVPDVIVSKEKGLWITMLNPDAVPKLRINRMYADILGRGRGNGGQQLAGQLQEAKWLIKNVQQRFETILRVSQAIVDRQRNFFEHGEVAMRPLVLREIAGALDLHESTISRVTTHKYMRTPRGIYELKFFFGSHVATDAGGAASSTAIRALIKQLVSAENTRKPLSDAQISQILGQQGIVVARRTVAKYRESLQILPGNLRKTL